MADEQLPAKDITPEGLPVRWSPSDALPDFAVQTSFEDDSAEKRRAIVSLIEGECLRGADLINTVFDIQHYIAHPVEVVDPETGEVADAVRLLIITSDGTPISFCSLGILKSMQRIVYAEGRQPPFDPPVKVTLKQVATRGARRTFKLVPVKE